MRRIERDENGVPVQMRTVGPLPVPFGRILREARVAVYRAQGDLADAIGWTGMNGRVRVSKIEASRLPPPDDETVRLMALALSIDEEMLLKAAHEPFEEAPPYHLSSESFVCRRPATEGEWRDQLDAWNRISRGG